MDLNLSQFKIGYFILYKNPGTPFRNIVEYYQKKEGFSKTDSKYTHVEMSLGGQHSIDAIFPKIKIRDIRDRTGHYVKIVRPKIIDYSKKRKNVAIECLKRVNKFYGLGVIWFTLKDIIKRNIFSAIGDFCSELCGYGLYKYYVEYRQKEYKGILPKPYNQLYPADFLNKRYFEVIHEGYVPSKIDSKVRN